MAALPLVFTSANARAAGFTPRQIRHRVESRRWRPVRRGVYCTSETVEQAASDELLMLKVQTGAAILAVQLVSWASHSTARRLYGLPRLDIDPGWTELTMPRDRRVKRSREHEGVRLLPAAVPSHHTSTRHGLPVLTAARTVVDTARRHHLVDGLITADAALHLGRADAADIDEVLGDCAGWPGIVEARRTIGLASGKRESPLESRSFAFFVEEQLPLPECQVNVFTPAGILIGRVDFWWPQYRLVGEADGKAKYGDDYGDGPPPEERLWRERLRHDELDDADLGIIRWTHGDVTRRRAHTRARFERAFARAERRSG